MSGGREATPRTVAEWAMLAVACLVVGGVLAVVVAASVAGSHRPAAFELRRHRVERRAGDFYLPVDMRNVGDEAAADVTVQAELRVDGRTVAQGQQQVAFLAGARWRR